MTLKPGTKSFYRLSALVSLLLLFSVACGNASTASPTMSDAVSIAAPNSAGSDNTPGQLANEQETAVVASAIEPSTNNNLLTFNLPEGSEIIGTIEATVDGGAKTWYVLKEATCHWGATIATSRISLIGYENPASVEFSSILYNMNLTHRAWQQPNDLGKSRFIIEFDNPTPLTGTGSIDLHSLPRGGASVGDGIFMSYTNNKGDFIHGVSTIQGTYANNSDGTFSLNGLFTTSEFAERDSAGLTTLPGLEDGRFTITSATPLNSDLITEWFANCQ